MTRSGFLPTIAEPLAPLHSIVAWPPEVLDTWMRRQQERLNVRGFGLPHLNLRAPFQTPLRSKELVAAFRAELKDETQFDVQIKGWKRLPSVIFLECQMDDKLRDLHRRLLSIGPSSHAPYDGAEYRPHLTLGLGILPWAADDLWNEVQHLTPPLTSFTVTALSLTREVGGEVQELHTFPLEDFPPEEG
ncbi:2'-5' RNA ligase family protein [Deinococcus fonticola]|uniref:2'-5' RNA ligase family protein n=1 Tax=Deinococcus fonticola TaxID=2528713 RepID=UPI0010758871|nr:2'-5' RNA ligase family protein [Deinococcus fonticola]